MLNGIAEDGKDIETKILRRKIAGGGALQTLGQHHYQRRIFHEGDKSQSCQCEGGIH